MPISAPPAPPPVPRCGFVPAGVDCKRPCTVPALTCRPSVANAARVALCGPVPALSGPAGVTVYSYPSAPLWASICPVRKAATVDRCGAVPAGVGWNPYPLPSGAMEISPSPNVARVALCGPGDAPIFVYVYENEKSCTPADAAKTIARCFNTPLAFKLAAFGGGKGRIMIVGKDGKTRDATEVEDIPIPYEPIEKLSE